MAILDAIDDPLDREIPVLNVMQVSMFRQRGGGKGTAFEFFCIFLVKFPTLGNGK